MIKDPRGRKRTHVMGDRALAIERAFDQKKLPFRYTLKVKDIPREVRRLRSSFDMKDMQERVGVKFSLFPTEEGFVAFVMKRKTK